MTEKTDSAEAPESRGTMLDERTDWTRLGAVDPDKLADARAQLQWAAQTLTAAADVLDPEHSMPAIPPMQTEARDSCPVDDHARMQWNTDRRAITGLMFRTRASEEPLQIALGVDELALSVVDDAGRELHKLALHGYTMAIALAWLSEAISTDDTLRVRACALPRHEVGRGGRFSCDSADERAAFGEIARWYSIGVAALSDVQERQEATEDSARGVRRVSRVNRGPVVIDPQHLTACIRVPLGAGPSAPAAGATDLRVTYGMCPGDADIAQPYFYVVPSPLPETTELPPLSLGGRWHRLQYPGREIVGAVLTADAVLGRTDANSGASSASSRQAIVDEFLQTTIDRCRVLLRIPR